MGYKYHTYALYIYNSIIIYTVYFRYSISEDIDRNKMQ